MFCNKQKDNSYNNNVQLESFDNKVKRLGLIKITDTTYYYKDAQIAMTNYLINKKEDPNDFYIPKNQIINQDTIFTVWHKIALLPESADVLGNPGGKCRNLYYDKNKKQVIKGLLWK